MKKFTLCLLLTFVSTLTFASGLDVAPGLWRTSLKMYKDGKEFDPMAEMRAAMKEHGMEEQMEALKGMMDAESLQRLKQAQQQATTGGSLVCYTKETFKGTEAYTDQDSECTTKMQKSSAKHMVGTYTCKNPPSKGSFEWKTDGKKSITGTTIHSEDGATMKMVHQSKFVKADCGDVKPGF